MLFHDEDYCRSKMASRSQVEHLPAIQMFTMEDCTIIKRRKLLVSSLLKHDILNIRKIT